MKLKSGLVFVIAAVAFGAQARDMNSIQQSGELKVGVPGITRRWRFIIKPGSWWATMLIWRKISASGLG